MFIPTTREELQKPGLTKLDIILITGDSYIDSPFTGVAVIGKILMKQGFSVGIIAQPDMDSDRDITRLGEPSLFWGITSGAVDSMVSNYTALKKRRKSDDYTPGGVNNRRPDRALIAYTNLVKRYFKKSAPIVLGGIEASLRRVAHYDYWSDSIRRSVLFDSKADYLIYGMGESSVVELAYFLKNREKNVENSSDKLSGIRGLCYISGSPPSGYLELHPYELVKDDKELFEESFNMFYHNNDPLTATGLFQKHNDRYLVQNPPALYPDTEEMDKIASLGFERALHPYYRQFGEVRALDTIKFSIATHRGCYGECNFCSIAIHEGRTVRWRSEESILKEAEELTLHPDFKGVISDAGGPTANMYGFECEKKLESGACRNRRCLYPTVCRNLKPDHSKQISLLKKLSAVKGVKKVFVASGIRYDLLFADSRYSEKYIEAVVSSHVSGQLKVAPEHIEPYILDLMGKRDNGELLKFKSRFESISTRIKKRQFLTYYIMAAHPGCTSEDMKRLKTFFSSRLKMTPEQVQIFTPTPSSYSTLMYHTGRSPFTKSKIHVDRSINSKERQKSIITEKQKLFIKKRPVIKHPSIKHPSRPIPHGKKSV